MIKRSIYESIAPSVYATLLLGFSPIYFGKVGKNVMLLTNTSCSIIGLGYLALFISMIYIGSLGFNPVTDGNIYNFNTLARLLILVVTLAGDFASFVCLIQGQFQRHLLRNFFNSVAKIDRIFSKIGQSFNYNTEFYIYAAINFGGSGLTVGNLIMQLWNIKRGVEKLDAIPRPLLFCHLYTFTLIHHGESLFAICNLILRKRFEAVNLVLSNINNKCLMRIKHTNERKKIGVISDAIRNSKNEEKILDVCIHCHDKLSDLRDVVNKIFGFLVIVGSVVQFNTIVFAFCYCYYSIFIRPISSFGWFFWAVFRIYELIRKSVTAHLHTYETQATLQWINKLMIHCDVHIEEKLKMFALQIKHRNQPISAMGLFTIDGSFAFTIIGATTVYITIIYQFQGNKIGC